MFGWIAAIIISVLLILLGKAIIFLVEKTSAEKKHSIDSPLDIYCGSYALDKMFTTNKNPEESVAMQYERMCLLDPLTYKGDKRIPAIIDQYRKIIKGKELDPKAENIPSERINGDLNPDYRTYLTSQRKALSLAGHDTSWFDKEHERISKVNKIETINQEFTYKLVELGMPIEMLPFAYSELRVETWKATDWKRLIKLIKDEAELGEISREAVGAFILHNDNKEILFNREKLEAFHLYFEGNVPIQLINLFVSEIIDENDMGDIINLVQEDGYEWAEALNDVVKEKKDNHEKYELKEAYQLAAHKGIKYLPKEIE